MRRYFTALMLITAVLTHADEPPFAISSSCREFIQGLPSRTEYGWISETLNPGRRGGPVFVFYFYNPPGWHQPILVLNDAPEGDSHALSKKDWPFAPVFMDYRGTGCSSPAAQSPDAVAAGIVRDAEAVRTRLGYRRWSAYGEGFGALILHRYVRDAPLNLERALVISGPYYKANLGRVKDDAKKIRVNLEKNPGPGFFIFSPRPDQERQPALGDKVRYRSMEEFKGLLKYLNAPNS